MKLGVYAIVDGQFGSTGKGLLSSYLAHKSANTVDLVVSNAGPNSGHTFYDLGGNKHVLRQLPTFAVAAKVMHGIEIPVFLSGGSVIDIDILNEEAERYALEVVVSPQAAVVDEDCVQIESGGTVAAIASTQKGTGAALARKIMRHPFGVMRKHARKLNNYVNTGGENVFDYQRSVTVLEVSQGFSLGIHSMFYPHVTSRECTVMQGMADARIPPQLHRHTYMVVRTFPIRVGNLNGNSSGEWYPDQQELSWGEVGVEPETTTVTGRVRRVATFSGLQFREALRANMPSTVFVNFMNYLKPEHRREFVSRLFIIAEEENIKCRFLYGFGPSIKDVRKGYE